MIARIYETLEKTQLQKIKKTIQKEKEIKKIVESYEDQLVQQKPKKGYCGRCQTDYEYGDNEKDSDKCPNCVCVDCGDSIMDRKRYASSDKNIIRCYPCWYEDYRGRIYTGSLRGYEITYDHIKPKLLKPLKKKVVVQKEVITTETVHEEVEVEEPITITETKLVDVKNKPYNKQNLIIKQDFSNYKEFFSKYLTMDKFFQDSELAKHEKWYGSKSHSHVLELLRIGQKKFLVPIKGIGYLDYNQLIVGEKQLLEEFPSVVGFYPNVPAYIQGHPLNMYNNKRINKVEIEKSINIYFNATMDSKNFDSQYKHRGIICYSLIEHLINEEHVKVNLKLIDASFIDGQTLIQTIDFDYHTIINDLDTVYNFLTVSAVLRVMMQEYKTSLIHQDKLSNNWLTGLGYVMDETSIRELLSLNDNDIFFGTPDELNISGFNLHDDFIRSMESLGINDEDIFENEPEYDFIEDTNDKVDVKKVIKDRKITKLIHFTTEQNLQSIIKNGILSRDDLNLQGIDFMINDHQRLEGKTDAICLSVQQPNLHLLKECMIRYPDVKYMIIEIDPAILYEIIENNEQVKRIYCDYNAASRYTQTSQNNLSIMFKDKIKKRHIVHDRNNKEANIPTSDQAEILFFGKIPSKYIMKTYEFNL